MMDQQQEDSATTEQQGQDRRYCISFVTPDPVARIGGTSWAQGILGHIEHEEPGTTYRTQPDAIVLTDMTTNNHAYNEQAIRVLREKTQPTPLIIFIHDDPEAPMESLDALQNMIVFRNSVTRSTKRAYERVMPSFQAADNGIEALPPATCAVPHKPKIGFCGVGKWPSRRAVCDALAQKANLFDTHFVFRDDHHTRISPQQQQANKSEFDAIMQECPYQLAGRGAGNWSHRFYEVLAAGRIPVLIDTDSMWPIDHVPLALWKRCVVIAKDAASLPATLIQFHALNDIAVTQVLCRYLWDTYFSFQGFAPVVQDALTTLVQK